MRARMQVVIPLTLALVFAILYANFSGAVQALLVMTSVPLTLVGSIALMAVLGYNTSVAAYVGMIALIGVAAETSSVMVVYLDQAFTLWRSEGRLRSPADLLPMALEACVPRARAIVMAVGMNILGLVPIMLSQGTGADVAKRIASPMQGGLVSLTVMTLFVIPAVYVIWRARQLRQA
jgi:Cu(I)/Ag(I) efflux system membrane protein CusA/SilA